MTKSSQYAPFIEAANALVKAEHECAELRDYCTIAPDPSVKLRLLPPWEQGVKAWATARRHHIPSEMGGGTLVCGEPHQPCALCEIIQEVYPKVLGEHNEMFFCAMTSQSGSWWQALSLSQPELHAAGFPAVIWVPTSELLEGFRYGDFTDPRSGWPVTLTYTKGRLNSQWRFLFDNYVGDKDDGYGGPLTRLVKGAVRVRVESHRHEPSMIDGETWGTLQRLVDLRKFAVPNGAELKRVAALVIQKSAAA